MNKYQERCCLCFKEIARKRKLNGYLIDICKLCRDNIQAEYKSLVHQTQRERNYEKLQEERWIRLIHS